MTVRLHVPLPLHGLTGLTLPPGASRHVQVLRLQPGDEVELFDGAGQAYAARIVRIGRQSVDVERGAAVDTLPEAACAVTLAVGMPANDRMDALVEKATELGVAAIQPLVCDRAVLRLAGERAERKVAHWQAVAAGACEQSGRSTLPRLGPVSTLAAWLQGLPPPEAGAPRWVLSLRDTVPLATLVAASAVPAAATFLSGPEGGLSEAEEDAARRHGFTPVSLGPRILRADTAPLAALAWLGLQAAVGGA